MINQLEKETEMLERHLELLAAVIEHEPIGIVKLGSITGYPNHKVRYSLRVLEEEELIEPTPKGAVTTDRVQGFLSDHRDSIDGVIAQLRGIDSSRESQQSVTQ